MTAFTGVLGHVKQDIVVRELGGVLVTPAFPTRSNWQAMLDHYAPGCGSPIHVQGTNGGTMPCGGHLNENGKQLQLFCSHCATDMKP